MKLISLKIIKETNWIVELDSKKCRALTILRRKALNVNIKKDRGTGEDSRDVVVKWKAENILKLTQDLALPLLKRIVSNI